MAERDDMTERARKAYEEYKEHFDGFFHDALWQVMVNEATGGEVVAFSINQERADGPYNLVIAYESGGFERTLTNFLTVNFSEASLIAESLSIEIFNLSQVMVKRVRAQSFRKSCEA